MTKKTRKNLFSPSKLKEIQSYISHALARYREDNSLNQTQMAEHFGYSRSRYHAFEKGLDLDNKLLKSFETIHYWAKGLDMSPDDFWVYIMSGSKTVAKKGVLLRWQEELFHALNKLKPETRRRWSQALSKQRKTERLEKAFLDMTQSLELSKKESDIISELVRVLHKS